MSKSYVENRLYDYDNEIQYLISLLNSKCIYIQYNPNGDIIAVWKIKFKNET
jgi:hypothetical protein